MVDKSSAVRDAVFGNVGTTIIFRVGADDAEFLESEFEPEFTPQDIVNLPNYKVYMKLMIDGVTSRPFSAKTLPPLVKGGDRSVEDEVIRSSRALYCRPKEVVEREINDWSGMSLGDDAPGGSGVLEKFPVICSNCKKETTVPFKPEPGRPVYCKDCIAKIKSGEIKVTKGSENQIKHDEVTFFKPLADLGIEFEGKSTGKVEEGNRHPERVDSHVPTRINPSSNIPTKIYQPKDKPANPAGKPGILGSIKKVFTPSSVKTNIPQKFTKPIKPVHTNVDNVALREVLNKTLGAIPKPQPKAVSQPISPVPAPVSLDTLKNKNKEAVSSKDRAASSEDMNKLKDLITAAGRTPQNAVVAQKISAPVPTPDPTSIPIPQKPVREVPEDVLRKVLE